MAHLIAVAQYFADFGGYAIERHTGGPLGKLEAVACATLGADKTPASILIIKAEALVPATHRAWTMTVLQKL
jgi:hypothetical protein